MAALPAADGGSLPDVSADLATAKLAADQIAAAEFAAAELAGGSQPASAVNGFIVSILKRLGVGCECEYTQKSKRCLQCICNSSFICRRVPYIQAIEMMMAAGFKFVGWVLLFLLHIRVSQKSLNPKPIR